MAGGKIDLDDPFFPGRLRLHKRRSVYERRSFVPLHSTLISDIHRPTGRARPVAKPASMPAMPAASSNKALLPATTAPRPIKQPEQNPRVALSQAKQSMVDVIPTRVPLTPPKRQIPSRVLKRQGVNAPLFSGQSVKHPTRLPRSSKVLTAVAVAVIIGGIGIGYQGFRANRAVIAKTAELSTGTVAQKAGVDADQSTTDIPAETGASNPDTHTVAAALPRTITISKIGVFARVVKVGVKANNQLVAPGNIFDVGWYDATSRPGEAGAMLFDGHVSGPTKHGVFYDLKKLVAGDKINVERGDRKVFTYKVVKKVAYEADKVDMAAALTPITAGKPGLNLITCSGDIDDSGSHYEERTVVFAEQIL